MGKFVDLTGQQFGDLLVLERAENKRISNRTTFVMWKCKCLNCEKETIVKSNNLKSGNSKSCGCRNMEALHNKRIDISNQRFGKLVALEVDEEATERKHRVMWLCRCDCGNTAIVSPDKLKNGESASCGCFFAEQASDKYLDNIIGKTYGLLTVVDRAENMYGDKTSWICECECGNVVTVPSMSLKRGLTKSCGCFHYSYGERDVQEWFKKNKILFNTQQTFDDLRNPITNRKLRFDFSIIDKDNRIIALLEYQGIQHYKEIDYHNFGKQQREITDQLKKNYCNNNDIKLYEIRYDQKIEIELEKIIQELNYMSIPCQV